jgi:hypothetical protein
MKNESEQNQDPLDGALAEWRVRAPLPPRFQEQVWRRIAGEGAEARTTWWKALRDWLQPVLARPAFAIACVTLLLALGSGTGWWQARQKSARLENDLGARYVQSLDPYQKMRM